MAIMCKTKVTCLLALAGAVGLVGCNMEYDPVPVNIPQTTIEPNTTLMELKEAFWLDDANYATEIGEKPDGSHYIVGGHVVSSDLDGNVFKSLVLQDETCALAFAIDTYDIYINYRRGQRIVLDITGLKAGKYNGLFQVGEAMWYSAGQVWETSFMPPALFSTKAELDGLPDINLIDTIEVNNFARLALDAQGLRTWQSQLVKLNNVRFTEGGLETFSTFRSSGTDREIEDIRGNRLKVRTSGYSTFWDSLLPTGRGDLVCLLGYYGSSWQLIMIDKNGCMNFGNPTVSVGTQENPYTVADLLEFYSPGEKTECWVEGYIVGWIEGQAYSTGCRFDLSGNNVSQTNLLIAATPTERDITRCVPVQLPSGEVRKALNLYYNPSNLGKMVALKGGVETYYNVAGLKGVTEYEFK